MSAIGALSDGRSDLLNHKVKTNINACVLGMAEVFMLMVVVPYISRARGSEFFSQQTVNRSLPLNERSK